MAQTQGQWLAKISKFVPAWYFENKEANVCFTVGVFNGIAAVFAQIAADVDSQQASTFILDSAAPVTDLHGDERSLPRLTSEADGAYAGRIQNCLFQPVGVAKLYAVIQASMNNGDPVLIENEVYGFYDDPDISENPGFLYFDDYYSRWLNLTKFYNWWTLITPQQTAGVDATIQANIVAAIEANKALGTTYDIKYETTDSPGDADALETEDGIQLMTESGSGLVTE